MISTFTWGTPGSEADGAAEAGHRRPPLGYPPHPEGDGGDAVRAEPRQAALRHGDLRHGRQHASQDRRVRQHKEARRERVQDAEAGRVHTGKAKITRFAKNSANFYLFRLMLKTEVYFSFSWHTNCPWLGTTA